MTSVLFDVDETKSRNSEARFNRGGRGGGGLKTKLSDVCEIALGQKKAVLQTDGY